MHEYEMPSLSPNGHQTLLLQNHSTPLCSISEAIVSLLVICSRIPEEGMSHHPLMVFYPSLYVVSFRKIEINPIMISLLKRREVVGLSD